MPVNEHNCIYVAPKQRNRAQIQKLIDEGTFETLSQFCIPPQDTQFVNTLETHVRAPKKSPTLPTIFRLPPNIIPSRYTLCIKPLFSSFTFEGCAIIECKVLVPTKTVVLNALDLHFGRLSWVEKGSKKSQPALEYEISHETQRLIMTFDPPLKQGHGLLRINYTGNISNLLIGCYRSKSTGFNGEEVVNVITALEPTGARRVLPCWDEPGIKARFDLSFIVPKHLTVLSNMPVQVIKEHRTDSDLHVIEFETTPLMSTYLLAFVIGTYEEIRRECENGVSCKLYAAPSKCSQGEYGLERATVFLLFLENYFNVKYPLKKMDLVAAANYNAGAMENWGLLIFRASSLLLSPSDENNTYRKIRICYIVAHEISHMWFGNLVTMSWWNDLWLKEGFAQFMQFLCINGVTPEWRVWDNFLVEVYRTALELDSLKSSHPIESHVQDAGEISELFDHISYHKGASVIRMFHKYIGDEDFRRGIQLYFETYAFRNTRTEDLLKILEDVSKKPVGAMMTNWIKSMGYPLITVSTEWAAGVRKITLRQEPFGVESNAHHYHHHHHHLHKEQLTRWAVPISIVMESDPETPVSDFVLTQHSVSLEIEGAGQNEWFKLNAGAFGFYRVKYTIEQLGKFAHSLRHQVGLTVQDRFNLLNDIYALVRYGHYNSVELLTVLEDLSTERSYIVWAQIDDIIEKMDFLFADMPFFQKFRVFARGLYSKIYQHMDWKKEKEYLQSKEHHQYSLDDHDTVEEHEVVEDGKKDYTHEKLRFLVTRRLLLLGDEHCSEVALEKFMRFLNKASSEASLKNLQKTKIESPSEIDLVMYMAGIMVADHSSQTYHVLTHRYKRATDWEDKQRILQSLCWARDERILREILELSLLDVLRRQEVLLIIKTLMQNPLARKMTWNFFKEHSHVFSTKFSGGFMGNDLIGSLVSNFVTEQKSFEVQEFFKAHPFPGTSNALRQALEKIEISVHWLRRDLKLIQDFLAPYTSNE